MSKAVVFEFVGDSRKLERALKQIERDAERAKSKFERLGQGFQRAGEKLTRVGTRMTVGITAPLALFGKAATDAASDLEQSFGAIESVFGDASRKIEAFGRTAADSFGLSRREVNETASVLGASLQSMGFEAGETADTVIRLQKRAADMAATFGGTTKDALEAVASLMRGERDPIEKYGVAIKQADINARLAAEGLDKLEGEAKKQAEAQAALALLFEQTAKVEGQFGREAETVAGKTARATAEFENQQAEIGKRLIPIKMKLLEIGEKLLRWFERLSPAQQDAVVKFGLITAAVGPAITALGGFLTVVGKTIEVVPKAGAKIKAVATFLMSPWGAALGAATLALGAFITSKQNAIRANEEMRSTLDQETAAITDNTRAYVANQLERTGALKAAKVLGIEFSVLTDAVLGDKDAMAQLNETLKGHAGLSQLSRKEQQKWLDAANVVHSVTSSLNSRLEEQVARQKRVNAAMADGAAAARGLAEAIRSIPTEHNVRINVSSSDVAHVLRGLPGREHGGPVTAWRPYIVGEDGPEVFVPDTAGRIVSNDDLRRTTHLVEPADDEPRFIDPDEWGRRAADAFAQRMLANARTA